ncbi:MAG TPA: hypothetical protein VF103_10990 [Polyangiaceae bacterium]
MKHGRLEMRYSLVIRTLVASLGAFGCEEAPDASAEAVNPSALFWDSLWTVEGTFAETNGNQTLPLPTDTELLDRIRYTSGDAEPPRDLLEGAEITFEIDGRLLVQAAGVDAPEYARTDYQVIDPALFRASINKSGWFDYTYAYDEAPRTLLIQPEPEASPVVMGLVFDIVGRTLLSGDLESPAARIAGLLLDDPRVPVATDAFVHSLVHGGITSVPIVDAADVTGYLAELLRESAVVGPEVSEGDLETELTPIAENVLGLDQAGIARALVDALAENELVTQGVSSERAGRVLDLALYRRALDESGATNGVNRLDLVLRRLP